MVRLRRPPEWGVEPVPPSLRVLRTVDLFVLWSSLGVGLLVLAAGTLLVGVGGLRLRLALGGPLAVIRAWLEKFAIWLVYASTAAIGIALILKGPSLGIRSAPQYFSGTTSLLLALDLVIAMPVSWWPLISDYNRFARSSKDSLIGTAAGYTIANTVFYMLGAGLMALGIAIGQPNFLAVIGLLGLGAFPLLIILVDETDNAFANIYSTAVSIQNLAPRRRQLTFIAAATVIAMAGAAFLWSRGEGLGGGYEGFLFLIGGPRSSPGAGRARRCRRRSPGCARDRARRGGVRRPPRRSRRSPRPPRRQSPAGGARLLRPPPAARPPGPGRAPPRPRHRAPGGGRSPARCPRRPRSPLRSVR